MISGDKFEENEQFKAHLTSFFEFCDKRNRTIRIVYFHGDFGDTWTEDGSVPIIREEIKKFIKMNPDKDNSVQFAGVSMNMAAKSSMNSWKTAFKSS